MQRRRLKGLAIGGVLVLLAATILIVPVQAGHAVKTTYHALPAGVRDLVPDSMERSMGEGVDSVSRTLTFGNRHQLILFDLRLLDSTLAPGSWGPDHDLRLRWTDLGPGIEYQVHVAHNPKEGLTFDQGRQPRPNATIHLPGDGDWYVRVRPYAGPDGGHSTWFGPFRIDSTKPPAPVLSRIATPPGYTFSIQWSPVEDASGIVGYQVERLGGGSLFQPVTRTPFTTYVEDQLGNGAYQYRILAINGAGLLGTPSNAEPVTVKAPMSNPGPGVYRYGIQANYTSFLKMWDLSNPNLYARTDEAPASVKSEGLAEGWGFDIHNQTLIQKTHEVVGSETNTMLVAQRVYAWLFDYADYDTDKLNASFSNDAAGLQTASQTYDLRKGICGDLATLYITMLRIAGVPSRAVHGYLDNPSAGIGDFHVWVEVWVGESLRSSDPTDTRDDWMTVDVSGITGRYDTSKLMIYFGIFNPEYLALGTQADYSTESWNSWAQFGWSARAGTPDPRFVAEGHPVELGSKVMDLYFNTQTKKRVLVEPGEKPPGNDLRTYFPNVKVVSKKRIDYGVNVSGQIPNSATIRIRYPLADAFANVLPWQSVIFTIYQNADASRTANKDPSTGKSYQLQPFGFVEWDDDFR